MLSDLAFALANAGFLITVITSKRGPSANLLAAEIISGVEILRIGSVGVCSSNFIGRAMEYLEFYAAATWLLLARVARGDIIVAKTDPPLVSVFAGLSARSRSGKLVNWLQVLYPEVANKLGFYFARGPTGWMLRKARDAVLRSACMNVAIGDRMAVLLRKHVAAHKIKVIPNWVDDSKIQPLAASITGFSK
ncbi:MAG: glycosyltransferase [Methylovirgula sp.]